MSMAKINVSQLYTYTLEEDLKNATGLFVDKTGDTFHTATTSETADGLMMKVRYNLRTTMRIGLRAW